MIWLWVSLAGWLAGARGTYGQLAHRGWVAAALTWCAWLPLYLLVCAVRAGWNGWAD